MSVTSACVRDWQDKEWLNDEPDASNARDALDALAEVSGTRIATVAEQYFLGVQRVALPATAPVVDSTLLRAALERPTRPIAYYDSALLEARHVEPGSRVTGLRMTTRAPEVPLSVWKEGAVECDSAFLGSPVVVAGTDDPRVCRQVGKDFRQIAYEYMSPELAAGFEREFAEIEAAEACPRPDYARRMGPVT